MHGRTIPGVGRKHTRRCAVSADASSRLRCERDEALHDIQFRQWFGWGLWVGFGWGLRADGTQRCRRGTGSSPADSAFA